MIDGWLELRSVSNQVKEMYDDNQSLVLNQTVLNHDQKQSVLDVLHTFPQTTGTNDPRQMRQMNRNA